MGALIVDKYWGNHMNHERDIVTYILEMRKKSFSQWILALAEKAIPTHYLSRWKLKRKEKVETTYKH